mmetsp:Transcript_42250/g.91855  ORF Transcript_42250/g.91855 Transcript_42250/m.91855 type:complete len:191 (-) Transcript_42250:1078-1650(-)
MQDKGEDGRLTWRLVDTPVILALEDEDEALRSHQCECEWTHKDYEAVLNRAADLTKRAVERTKADIPVTPLSEWTPPALSLLGRDKPLAGKRVDPEPNQPVDAATQPEAGDLAGAGGGESGRMQPPVGDSEAQHSASGKSCIFEHGRQELESAGTILGFLESGTEELEAEWTRKRRRFMDILNAIDKVED